MFSFSTLCFDCFSFLLSLLLCYRKIRQQKPILYSSTYVINTAMKLFTKYFLMFSFEAAFFKKLLEFIRFLEIRYFTCFYCVFFVIKILSRQNFNCQLFHYTSHRQKFSVFLLNFKYNNWKHFFCWLVETMII